MLREIKAKYSINCSEYNDPDGVGTFIELRDHKMNGLHEIIYIEEARPHMNQAVPLTTKHLRLLHKVIGFRLRDIEEESNVGI